MKKYLFFIILLGFIIPFNAFAAELYFGINNKTAALNTNFEIGFFINTQQESINAIESQITFPSDRLQFQGIYSGNSLITFWVQQPKLVSPGVISFSGIIPGGFIGPKGYLLSVVFKPIKSGGVTVATNQETILLNDGNGTEAKVTKAPLALTVSEKSSVLPFIPPVDNVPPEDFKPEISSDGNLFDGKWFLVFVAQDKGVGIDRYEVREGSFGDFEIAQSPYLLKNQKLNQDIFVKAQDKSGNTRVVMVPAQNPPLWYKNYLVFVILIIIGMIIGFIVDKKRFQRKKK